MGQVLAVVSGKGGTGKTSLAAGVAACLAAEGERVLCIDCDVGLRDLDISLGMSDLATTPFTAVMDGECELEEAAVEHPKIPGLFLLTAPVSRSAEDLDSDAFCALLDGARERYGWILLDSPAGVGRGLHLTVRFVDRAVIVSGVDPASLRDAARCAEVTELEGVSRMELVVDRVAPKLLRRIGTTIDDVMDGVGLPLLGIIPEDPDVTLAAAAGTALPLFTSLGASVGCLHIARRLRGIKAPLMRL